MESRVLESQLIRVRPAGEVSDFCPAASSCSKLSSRKYTQGGRTEPLTQSLLLWGRQGGASSRYHAVLVELHSFQHPVENAEAPQEPHHWLYCEYLGTGISVVGVIGVTIRPAYPFSSYIGPPYTNSPLLITAPVSLHETRANVSLLRVFVSA